MMPGCFISACQNLLKFLKSLLRSHNPLFATTCDPASEKYDFASSRMATTVFVFFWLSQRDYLSVVLPIFLLNDQYYLGLV